MMLLMRDINHRVGAAAVSLESIYQHVFNAEIVHAFWVWENDIPTVETVEAVEKIQRLVFEERDKWSKVLDWAYNSEKLTYFPQEEEFESLLDICDNLEFNILRVQKLYAELMINKALNEKLNIFANNIATLLFVIENLVTAIGKHQKRMETGKRN